ncbi:hypothetical protein PsorP6_009261 [Peronosclerospora sorghi]|uniref:Uncharacterized protein n=1 Tax=Peronosclerospora sorghi TaxID=230839 RepID=A0ACC0VYB1_9STRA|nr:hypothetical protein PsorP6_009261 [Peronosclerospora sorghi]
MLRSTKLGELSVGKIYDTLLAYATPSAEEAVKMSKSVGGQSHQMYSYAAVEENEGAYLVLTRANIYECVRCLVSKNNMSEKAQKTSSKLLSRLFKVFGRKRSTESNWNDSRFANVWSNNSIAEQAAGAVVSKLFGEVIVTVETS